MSKVTNPTWLSPNTPRSPWDYTEFPGAFRWRWFRRGPERWMRSLADVHDQLHIVLDQEDADLEAVADEADEIHQLDFFLRIHPGSGFVEQQDFRTCGQGPGDFDASLIAVRKVAGVVVGAAGEMKEFEKLRLPSRERSLGARLSHAGGCESSWTTGRRDAEADSRCGCCLARRGRERAGYFGRFAISRLGRSDKPCCHRFGLPSEWGRPGRIGGDTRR